MNLELVPQWDENILHVIGSAKAPIPPEVRHMAGGGIPPAGAFNSFNLKHFLAPTLDNKCILRRSMLSAARDLSLFPSLDMLHVKATLAASRMAQSWASRS